MRSTTRGTPYRNVGQSRCLGRVAALFALATPFALGLGACAKSSGIEVVDGGTIGVGGSDGADAGGGLAGSSKDPGGDCGPGSILCGTGNGCCESGYVCSKANSTCIPDKACTQNSDCSSDSVCGGGKCVAWASFPTSLNYSNSCRSQIDLPSVRPEVQCSWPGDTPPGESPDAVQVISTPMVVDFDFDHDPKTIHPSIVFISYTGDYTKVTGVLRVIDGATCALQATIPGAATPGEFPFLPQVAPAIGDIDGDGHPDIVVADVHQVPPVSTKYGIAVYTPVGDGTTNFKLIGRQDSSATAPVQAISVADLDNDSRAEIITDTGIFEFSPDLPGKIAERDNISGSALEPPIVHDIDGDRIAEMITTQGIFSWDAQNHKVVPKTVNGNPVWNSQDFIQSQFIGASNMGNFPTQLPGGNDSVELVVVGFAGQMYVTRVDGGIIQNINLPGTSGGPPVIADFDGDGRMEFASPGFDQLTVFDLDCLTDDNAKPVKANCMGTPNANGMLWQVT
ncbi:MAG TPA: FG-GAP-like repeat-containing protein, partial [Polyangiaceae bacterium]|nr:FG-GAP-like repeat-containing protein [Polyangiaceae bacterium]